MKTKTRQHSQREIIEGCVRSNVPKKLADKFLNRLYHKKRRPQPTYRVRVIIEEIRPVQKRTRIRKLHDEIGNTPKLSKLYVNSIKPVRKPFWT